MTVKVLIVDDSKLARIVVGKAVSSVKPDWTRVEAGSADEAVEIIGSTGVDLAILDYNMPGKNGIELAEEIRKDRPDMPIAIATANIQDEIIARARAVGAVFVPKPISEDSLRGFLSGAALQLRAKGE